MKFQIQENDLSIVNHGNPFKKNGSTVREVTFDMKGKQFTREILMSDDEENANYANDEEFYQHNQEAIEKNLIDFFSDHQTYENR